MEFAGLQNFVNILGMAAGERGYVLSYLKNTLVMWGSTLFLRFWFPFFWLYG